MTKVRVVQMRQKVSEGIVVNACSNTAVGWQKDLSPFLIGPCNIPGGYTSLNMENAWQFSKVYKKHLDENGDPSHDWWSWSTKGWSDSKAHRYPMGRGAVPEYSYWNGKKLGYIDARKHIYAPLYKAAVEKTEGYQHLKELYKTSDQLVIRDFDGYDYLKKGMTLTEVLNEPKKKMGHAFVLAMMLMDDPALKECKI